MADTIYESGEVIFTEGDPSHCAYVIKMGQVEILDHYPGNPFRLGLLGDGDIFGEMGLIDERPRSLTARAVVETRVTEISRDEFADMIISRPEEALRYLKMFFERLRAMNMRVADEDEPSKASEAAPKHDYAVTITPMTSAGEEVLPPKGLVVKRFPFRVGRRSTHSKSDPLGVNDISFPDEAPYNISKNHFEIGKSREGVIVYDRGSYLGTIVNGEVIGGHHRGAMIKLNDGENEVIAGSSRSPFKFRIDVKSF